MHEISLLVLSMMSSCLVYSRGFNTHLQFADNVPDLPPFSTLSVELKSKDGVLPFDPRAHPVRRARSKYVLKQLLKLRQGTIAVANDYDPLDLFSGNSDRMTKALHSLISNPQNNLRVFIDGSLKFGSGNPGFESLSAALKPFFSCKENVNSDVVPVFLKMVRDALLLPCQSLISENVSKDRLNRFSVLGGLFEAQRSCSIDIEPLYPQYQRVCQLFNERPNLRRELAIDGPAYGDSAFWRGECLEKLGLSQYEIDALGGIRSYLATSTLKDCSIFLTFQKQFRSDSSASTFPAVGLSDGSSLVFQASLVDLDPKPFERIERHYIEAKSLIDLADGHKIGV